MSILISRRAKCDQPGCIFVSGPYADWPTLNAYLAGATDDGKWYVGQGTQRTICRGCIINRACRIFGHAIVRQPDVLGGRTACTRCQTFQDPVASLEITFGTRETGPIRGGFISPGWECR